MAVRIRKGNIFTSAHQTLVNTVNCKGVMGAGIALEFKLRLPEMYEQYVDKCKNREIAIGKSWLYKPSPSDPRGSEWTKWVLNFPTKWHWKYDSKLEYLEECFRYIMASPRGSQTAMRWD